MNLRNSGHDPNLPIAVHCKCPWLWSYLIQIWTLAVAEVYIVKRWNVVTSWSIGKARVTAAGGNDRHFDKHSSHLWTKVSTMNERIAGDRSSTAGKCSFTPKHIHGTTYEGRFTRSQVTWGQFMQSQPLESMEVGVYHFTTGLKYDMDTHMAMWRWELGLVLRVRSSKKLDPSLNTSPMNIFFIKIIEIQL